MKLGFIGEFVLAELMKGSLREGAPARAGGGACVHDKICICIRKKRKFLSCARSFRHFLAKMPPPSRREATK